jgi:CheY-like chemotaxis protein
MWPAASERFRQRVAVIEDCVAEVVLGKAHSADPGDARDAAHKLAGTLGLFGLNDGSVHAKELDERFDGHPDYEPETVERLAHLTNALRIDIERRSRESIDDGSPLPPAEGVVWAIGGHSSRGESIRWLLGGRGVEVEAIDPAAVDELVSNPRGGVDELMVHLSGLEPPLAVLVDPANRLDPGDGGLDLVGLVAAISTRLPDCPIVVLTADDDLATRNALLDAGAWTAAGRNAEPATVVEALLQGEAESSGSTVVVVGIDPTERSGMMACFNAVGIAVEMVDAPIGPGCRVRQVLPFRSPRPESPRRERHHLRGVRAFRS